MVKFINHVSFFLCYRSTQMIWRKPQNWQCQASRYETCVHFHLALCVVCGFFLNDNFSSYQGETFCILELWSVFSNDGFGKQARVGYLSKIRHLYLSGVWIQGRTPKQHHVFTEIGLSTQNLLIFLDSTVNIIIGGAYMIT